MKSTLPSSSPTTPLKPDAFQRLSLAVKKLDQLINRTHQLGTFANELLREETTGSRYPSPETELTQSAPSDSSTTTRTTERLLEK